MSKNPQHLADQTTATRIKEHYAYALAAVGNTPAGTGTHRADDAETESAA